MNFYKIGTFHPEAENNEIFTFDKKHFHVEIFVFTSPVMRGLKHENLKCFKQFEKSNFKVWKKYEHSTALVVLGRS